jgi:hypothetical protein
MATTNKRTKSKSNKTQVKIRDLKTAKDPKGGGKNRLPNLKPAKL